MNIVMRIKIKKIFIYIEKMDKEMKEYYKKQNFDLTEINKMLKVKLKETEDKNNQLENKLGEQIK